MLYILGRNSEVEVAPFLSVTVFSTAIAAVALVSAIMLRLWAPADHLREAGTIAFVLLIATLGSIVIISGEIISPFGALLSAASIFAGYFGIAGIFMALATIVASVSWQYMTGTPALMLAQEYSLTALVPLIMTIVIWFHYRPEYEARSRADTYSKITSHLSQVAGSSDVVINAIGEGVIALSAKGDIELINPAAQRIIGWDKHDAVGLNYKSVLKLVDARNAPLPDIMHPIEKALHDNKSYSSDIFSLVTTSDKSVLISIVASPIGQTGSGVIVVFRDITSEKAEEREQAEFISTASHEMRTPVASIEGYLGLTLNPATATIDDRARDFIAKAHSSAQHLGRLFQDLLDVSKADDGRLGNTPAVVDVVSYVHEIFTGLKQKADEKQLHYIYKPSPDNQTVVGADRAPTRQMNPAYYAFVDNDHLREIVANLIENAIKYTPAGDVVVDVTGDQTEVIISVTDTGLGIPAEDQPHLFQKFYRVDNTDTREIGGTGLGLYLCRRLAETIGGKLWVESLYKKGSTFYLKIPRLSHEEATRLIEKASVEAEKAQAEAKAQAMESASPAPIPITNTPTVERETGVTVPKRPA